MGARTGGRAVALQVLYGLDASGGLEAERRRTLDVGTAIESYFRAFEDPDVQSDDLDPEARVFADGLLRELSTRFDQVDEAIRKASTNWRLERMPRVDRNILRVAAFELTARTDVPRAVVIDEAVELAKRYGGDESPKFINGILERVADDAGRPREEGPRRPRRR
jgi:transcription antitermination protein NusB